MSTIQLQDDPLQLNRRGRVVLRLLPLICLIALLAVGIVWASEAVNTHRAEASRQHQLLCAQPDKSMTVQQGQSLFQISANEYPGEDPRQALGALAMYNGLERPSLIQAGQQLKLPPAIDCQKG